MCFGKICAKFGCENAQGKNAGSADFRLITTVKSSGVSIDATSLKAARARLEYLPLISVNVWATSAEVNGRPSCQVTPRSSSNVYFSPSALAVQDFARLGPTLNLVSILISVS